MTLLKINGDEIPKDTIQAIGLAIGKAFVTGEAVNELDRKEISDLLGMYKDGDVVEYFAEDADFRAQKGLANILGIKKNEDSVGNLMRLNNSLTLQRIPQ